MIEIDSVERHGKKKITGGNVQEFEENYVSSKSPSMVLSRRKGSFWEERKRHPQ